MRQKQDEIDMFSNVEKEYYNNLKITQLEALVLLLCMEQQDAWLSNTGLHSIMIYKSNPTALRLAVKKARISILYNRVMFFLANQARLNHLPCTFIAIFEARESLVAKIHSGFKTKLQVFSPLHYVDRESYLQYNNP